MRIGKVTMRGVRGVPDGAWDVSDRTGEPHRMVVVTGPPACGKTRFLEAIIAAKELIAPYAQRPSTAPWGPPGGPPARVGIRWHLDQLEAAHGGVEQRVVETESVFAAGEPEPADEGVIAVLRRYEHGHTSGKLEYVPANRHIPLHGVGTGISAAEQKMLRATSDPRKYASCMRVLRDLAAGGEQASFFGHLLLQLSPTCRFEMTGVVDVMPRCFRGASGPRTLLELSASEQDAVLFAATATLIGLSYSVILIDRPELHVDPKFVPRLLDGLLHMGREPQVIIASSSAEVLAAVGRSQIVDLGAPPPASSGSGPARGGAAA